MAYLHLAHSLADAFTALADEVQVLTDRKTVLEHKLRFAHEQVSHVLRARYLASCPPVCQVTHCHTFNSLSSWISNQTTTASLPIPYPHSTLCQCTTPKRARNGPPTCLARFFLPTKLGDTGALGSVQAGFGSRQYDELLALDQEHAANWLNCRD